MVLRPKIDCRNDEEMLALKEKIEQNSFAALRNALTDYAPISEKTWAAFKRICTPLHLKKGDYFCRAGDLPQSFAFVVSGLLRVYITNAAGNEYNKIFFPENTFPASIIALLTSSPSKFTIEALETAQLIQIDFKAYRQLLKTSDELKLFHIFYLEKNWVIDKEKREVALVQEDALARYLHFLADHANLAERLSQYHIASHLGITPTQLSRIRKKIGKNQPM